VNHIFAKAEESDTRVHDALLPVRGGLVEHHFGQAMLCGKDSNVLVISPSVETASGRDVCVQFRLSDGNVIERLWTIKDYEIIGEQVSGRLSHVCSI
jgi:hypothetical protein